MRSLLKVNPPETGLAEAIGKDWKGWTSLAAYSIGIAAASINEWISVALYICVALLWLVPDPRIERVLVKQASDHGDTHHTAKH